MPLTPSIGKYQNGQFFDLMWKIIRLWIDKLCRVSLFQKRFESFQLKYLFVYRPIFLISNARDLIFKVLRLYFNFNLINRTTNLALMRTMIERIKEIHPNTNNLIQVTTTKIKIRKNLKRKNEDNICIFQLLISSIFE